MSNISLFSTWNSCLQYMRDNLVMLEDKKDIKKLEEGFDLLFDKVSVLSFESSNLTLQIPSNFYKEYIEDNYIKLLSSALRKYFGKNIKLWYQVAEIKSEIGVLKTKPQSSITSVTPKMQEVNNPNFNPQSMNAFSIPGMKKIKINSNLNPNLSFDNFIVGECNKFTASIANNIAKTPNATAFNPLFIHGGIGVGKTHIAHSIGLQIKELFPDQVVLYISFEKFLQHFVSASKAKKHTEFSSFYQMVDVLIVDDIQFISSKKATQEVFFHIFDHLHQNNKRIILTSDRAATEIQDVDERVLSRFKWGLSTEIFSPDYDTRRKIILSKLNRDGIDLQDDMIDFLAKETHTNVRELEGIINSVIAHATYNKSDINVELLKSTINKIAVCKNKITNINFIQQVVCSYFKITKEDLVSKSRKRIHSLPRQLAMYYCKKLTDETYVKIGQETGNKDHTTVIYSCEVIDNVSKTSKELRSYMKDLEQLLKH